MARIQITEVAAKLPRSPVMGMKGLGPFHVYLLRSVAAALQTLQTESRYESLLQR